MCEELSVNGSEPPSPIQRWALAMTSKKVPHEDTPPRRLCPHLKKEKSLLPASIRSKSTCE